MNLNAILAGAVRGAVQSVIPPVASDVVRTIHQAQDTDANASPVPPPATLDPKRIAQQVVTEVMNDPTVARITTPIPWWQSHAIWGNIISVASILAGGLGYGLSTEDQATLAGSLAAVGVAVGNGISVYGRLTTTRQIKGT